MVVEAPYRTCVTVTGLTCQHCVMSVTEGVADIDGVSAVDVRLDTGQLTVLSDRDVERGEIEAAVLEAGFELAG
jgi:copper ion binding protein